MRMVDANHDGYGYVEIENGTIVNVIWQEEKVEGPVLMPAFVDLHVHFRDPGQTHKEDLETGMRAALAGGYTDVQLMGNTKPITSSQELAEDVKNRADAMHLIDVHPAVSITKDFDGEDFSHLNTLKTPVRMITDDGVGVKSGKVMKDAMDEAARLGLTFTLHEEDPEFSKTDMRLAENLMTLRDLHLADVTHAKVHFAHVSTKECIDWIREHKKHNDKISCEVTPHHLVLWDQDYRVNPPIRKQEDVMALREALHDGTIDAIATDHAPHTKEDKEKGAPGMVGLEIAFALLNTHLIHERVTTLQNLSALLSEKPAKLLGLTQGVLEVGMDADLVVVDLDEEFTIDPETFYSKGRNTPFAGAKVKGRILQTMCKGEWKYPFS